MRIIRIYHPQPLKVGGTISLTSEARHHLMRVLRASMGDMLELFDGQGACYQAELCATSAKDVEVQVLAPLSALVPSSLKIHLAQGISRGERMDYSLQKATELGVHSMTPLISERCNVKLDVKRQAKREAHWRGVIISACEQCGRSDVPVLYPIQSIKHWVKQASATQQLVCVPGSTGGLASEAAGDVEVLIGPEGGLSDAEIAQATTQGFQAWSLGPRVLRTETATVVALSLLQAHWGDLV